MPNPWLAVDTNTPPASRARIVRQAWERFHDGDAVWDGRATIRAPIVDSWNRCRLAGVPFTGSAAAPLVADGDEAEARWQVHPLAAAQPLIQECLAPLQEEDHLLVVSDARGMLLWIAGDPRVRLAAAESMNFAAGALWSEDAAGTNAVGTALAADHAVQVFAAEHFHETVQTWSCSACPVHDPDSGSLLGVIDLTSRMSGVHAHALAVAMATARAVEAQLATAMQQRDAQLIAAHGGAIAGGGPRALVAASGRVISANGAWRAAAPRVRVSPETGLVEIDGVVAPDVDRVRHGDAFIVHGQRPDHRQIAPAAPRQALSLRLMGGEAPWATIDGEPLELRRRQAEIVALLAAHPDGVTADQLGADLYGDCARTGSVRVEISRLRKLIGPWLQTEPYRLATDVVVDLHVVRQRLERGELAEAAARHGAGLLPWSESPGVVRERDLVGHWLRQAVLASDDADALWEWVSTPGGDDDLLAWRRLLGRLSPRDPRRPRTVARLELLRSALTGPA